MRCFAILSLTPCYVVDGKEIRRDTQSDNFSTQKTRLLKRIQWKGKKTRTIYKSSVSYDSVVSPQLQESAAANFDLKFKRIIKSLVGTEESAA